MMSATHGSLRPARLVSCCLLLSACGNDPTNPPEEDTVAPEIRFGVGGAMLSDPGSKVGLIAMATDNEGVVRIEFFKRRVGVDPEAIKIGEEAADSSTLLYPAAGFVPEDNGEYRFHARAYDAAGNVGVSQELPVSVGLDGTEPAVMLSTPFPRLTTPGVLRFFIEGNEALPHVELYEGEVKKAETSGTFIPQTLTLGYTRADNGVHHYAARGFDGSGNVGISATLDVIVDIRWDWVKTFTDHGAIGVASDGAGGAYVVGGREDSNSSGSADLVTARYGPTGVEQWSRRFGDSNSETARAIARGPDGSVYVSAEKYIFGGIPDQDCVLLKYGADGVLIFSRQLGTSSSESECMVAVSEATGDVYLAGSTPGVFPGNTSAGRMDFFLAKYDAAGALAWIRQAGSVPDAHSFGDDYAAGVAVDPSGGVYLAGYTDGSVDGNPSAGSNDIVLIKYDASGNRLWSRQLGTADTDEALGIGADPSGGVYVTGWNHGGLDGRPFTATTKIVLARYAADGSLLWVRQPQSLGYQGYDYGYAVQADADRVYLVGQSESNFGAGPVQGLFDIALLTFDRQGTLVDAQALGSPLIDGGFGVAVDAPGEVFVAGAYGHDGFGSSPHGVLAHTVAPASSSVSRR